MPPISARPAVAISAVALLLAACGSNPASDSSSSAPASAPASTAAMPSEASPSAPSESSSASASASPSKSVAVSTGSGRTSVPDKIEKDRKNWVLPTDQYHVYDLVKRDRAERKTVISCLEEAEITGDFPDIDDSPEAIADMRRYDQAPLVMSEGHMSLAGYSKQLVEGANKAFKEELFKVVNEAPVAKHGAIQNCIFKFSKEGLQDAPYQQSDYEALNVKQIKGASPALVAFANKFMTEDVKKPEIVATIDNWRACMAPTGIDLSNETPMTMPPSGPAKEWDEEMNAEKKPFFLPEVHKKFAEQDISCRESSGFYEAVYNLQWDFLQQHVAEHQQYYESIKAWQEAKNKELEEFLKS